MVQLKYGGEWEPRRAADMFPAGQSTIYEPSKTSTSVVDPKVIAELKQIIKLHKKIALESRRILIYALNNSTSYEAFIAEHSMLMVFANPKGMPFNILSAYSEMCPDSKNTASAPVTRNKFFRGGANSLGRKSHPGEIFFVPYYCLQIKLSKDIIFKQNMTIKLLWIGIEAYSKVVYNIAKSYVQTHFENIQYANELTAEEYKNINRFLDYYHRLHGYKLDKVAYFDKMYKQNQNPQTTRIQQKKKKNNEHTLEYLQLFVNKMHLFDRINRNEGDGILKPYVFADNSKHAELITQYGGFEILEVQTNFLLVTYINSAINMWICTDSDMNTAKTTIKCYWVDNNECFVGEFSIDNTREKNDLFPCRITLAILFKEALMEVYLKFIIPIKKQKLNNRSQLSFFL